MLHPSVCAAGALECGSVSFPRQRESRFVPAACGPGKGSTPPRKAGALLPHFQRDLSLTPLPHGCCWGDLIRGNRGQILGRLSTTSNTILLPAPGNRTRLPRSRLLGSELVPFQLIAPKQTADDAFPKIHLMSRRSLRQRESWNGTRRAPCVELLRRSSSRAGDPPASPAGRPAPPFRSGRCTWRWH